VGINASRLDRCGWTTFDQNLFLNEPGRISRDLAFFFIPLLNDFCRGRRVLELCCGGGKLLTQVARAGYEATGIDLNESMLEVAGEQIKREEDVVRRRIRLIQEDMCTFNLEETFDFIILEDDGFHYLLTQEEQLACLERVREHLAPDGLFFLCFETPQKELASQQALEYDPVRQILTLRNAWTVVDETGRQSIVQQGNERRRQTYPCELELLLRCSGLEPIRRWGDYQRTPFSNPVQQGYVYLTGKTRG
jgi:SAM-dependent methyltransferase